MDTSQTPMTKFWSMTIKSPDDANVSDSKFNELLREIIEFCYIHSGRDKADHQFWEEDTDNPSLLVLITGYPTVESNAAADKEYLSSDKLSRMAQWVDSKRLVKCLENVEGAPLAAERLDFLVSDEEDEDCQDGLQWLGDDLVQGKVAGQVHVLLRPAEEEPHAVNKVGQGKTIRLRKRQL